MKSDNPVDGTLSGVLLKYAPVWAVVAVLLLLFFSSTLPAIRSSKALRPVETRAKAELEALGYEIERTESLLRALDGDAITVENELRKQFRGAKREGEILVGQ